MRKIIVGAFLSLDGVMQAPGGPEEDPSGGFGHGGWTVPYWDDAIAAAMGEAFAQPFDLLLGRRTYDIFAAHWPHVEHDADKPGFDAGMSEMGRLFDRITKYVATHRPDDLAWRNTQALGDDVPAALRRLKAQDGPDLITQGSSELVHLLLAHGLVDELRLLIYPLVLGRGKRLFDDAAQAARFEVTHSTVSPAGVVIARYARAGEVRTGSFALETPSEAETARRERMQHG